MYADLSLDHSLLKKVIEKKTLRPCQKRDISQDLVQEDKVSIVRAYRIVDLDRSMFYYESIRDDSEVETKLNSYVENKHLCNRGCPEYYKRLRREGIGWNHKRVERVY
jgi:putative transposase